MAARIRTNRLLSRLTGLAGGLWVGAALAGNPIPDPTRPAYHLTETGSIPPETVYHLQSILQSPTRTLAIINDQRVTIGDRVGNARVIAIRPGEVIVVISGRQRTLRLNPSVQITPLNNASVNPVLPPTLPPQPPTK